MTAKEIIELIEFHIKAYNQLKAVADPSITTALKLIVKLQLGIQFPNP